MTLQSHTAPDAAQLALALCEFVTARLRAALAERGHALLVVSGGNTPLPFFKALSQVDLDWSQVSITLADDRWLPPDHADSNERTVRASLLQGPAAQAKFVSLVTDAATPFEGQPAIEARLKTLPWPADVTLFGMGGDGHTASLFPFTLELTTALDDAHAPLCMAVSAPLLPNVPVPRLTLSRRALLDTRVAVVHITGASKWALLQQACEPGPVAEWPIRLVVRQQAVPVHAFHAD
jgi:6-phosphogluconolactonase